MIPRAGYAPSFPELRQSQRPQSTQSPNTAAWEEIHVQANNTTSNARVEGPFPIAPRERGVESYQSLENLLGDQAKGYLLFGINVWA
jgi:hypothetical protein